MANIGRARPLCVAIEGIDGAGKATAATLLRDKLAAQGRRAMLLSFPRYEETRAAALIGDLLNKRFASPSPECTASVFALDRAEFFASAALDADVLIFDRFVMSNVAFQMARLDGERRRAVAAFILDLEFEKFRTPRPDLNVLIDVSEPVAAQFILKKGSRSYTADKMDAFEADRRFQQAVRDAYHELAAQEAGGPWLVVPVAPETDVRMTPDEAADMILARL
jgi:dTMP kinase